MILVIPCLELINGKNLLTVKGKEGSENYYRKLSDEPLKLCKLIRSENFKTIHIDVVDSIENNFHILVDIAETLDIPIQLSADFQSINQCRELLEAGIYRIIVGDLAITHNQQIKEMIKEFTPSRIVCSVSTRNNIVSLKNVKKNYPIIDYIKLLKQTGIQRMVFSSYEWRTNPINIEELKILLKTAKIRTTIYGGIDSPRKLWQLEDLFFWGIDSMIIKTPFYLNKFPCQNMWREIESELQSFV